MSKNMEKKTKTIVQPIVQPMPEPLPKPSSSPIPALVASMTVKGVKAEVRNKYGFTPSEPFCQDLIAFVEEVTNDSHSTK